MFSTPDPRKGTGARRATRRLLTAAAGAAMITAIAATPGMAATKSLTIDGIKRPVSALSTMNGKVMVASPKKDVLVGFTDKAAFRAYAKKNMHVNLSAKKLKPVAAKKNKAKASWSGDYATLYQHYNGYGAAFNLNSGTQEVDFSRIGCFLWFCSNYNNMISSVRTHGTSAVLYDYEGFYGDVYVVGPNQLNNIPAWFNDRASSAYDAWSW
jgi:hypothetical protein